jgi:hypothetical protein
VVVHEDSVARREVSDEGAPEASSSGRPSHAFCGRGPAHAARGAARCGARLAPHTPISA